LALAAGADIVLANHPTVDNTIPKTQALKNRGAKDPNPFIVGRDGVRRFFTGANECAQAYAEQISN
jgi:metallo-beta-lactamase class B